MSDVQLRLPGRATHGEGTVPRTNYPGVYVEEKRAGVRTIAGVETSTAAFVGPTRRGARGRPVRVASFAEFERVCGGLSADSDLPHAVRHFFANGGKDARVVSTRRARGTDTPDAESFRAALARLVDTHFALLCLPDLARPDYAAFRREVYAEAAALCPHAGALLLIDPPPDVTTAAQAETWRQELPVNTSYAAAYFPRLQMRDPLTRTTRAFAPSGVVAGITARMDREHGPWRAPAGMTAVARGALGLASRVSSTAQGRLNAEDINCFRSFQERIVLFGARTLAHDATEPSEYKYVPVRRTASFITQSINKGLGWVVFEPNAEPLWAEIRRRVETFMHELFRAGAFQGRTPKEAYFVRCDASTVTQADIANGIVNIEVGFAPLRPAEFVVLRLSQITCRSCS